MQLLVQDGGRVLFVQLGDLRRIMDHQAASIARKANPIIKLVKRSAFAVSWESTRPVRDMEIVKSVLLEISETNMTPPRVSSAQQEGVQTIKKARSMNLAALAVLMDFTILLRVVPPAFMLAGNLSTPLTPQYDTTTCARMAPTETVKSVMIVIQVTRPSYKVPR